MKNVEIYTDGACRGNPGPGGYGCILVYGAHRRELSGGECSVTLYSDSKYLVDAVTLGWLSGWKRADYRRGKKDEVKNIDLWERLSELLSLHKVEFVWVKGHDGHPENERCDELATAAADAHREV